MLNDSSPWRVGRSSSYEATSEMDESSEAPLSGSRAGQIIHKSLNVLKIPFGAFTPIRTLHGLGLDKGQEILIEQPKE